MTKIEYIAAGANRHPSAADWIEIDGGDSGDGLLAFGSGRNVALWRPEGNGQGVESLLVGHKDTVNAVKFLKISSKLLIISGAVDKSVRIWHQSELSTGKSDQTACYQCTAILDEHQNSVNCIAVKSGAEIFATGSADATVKIWKVDSSGQTPTAQLLQSIEVLPRYFPLALAFSSLNGEPDSYILAVAGTAAFVQLYVADSTPEKSIELKLQATLSGHEGWVRSLSFTQENDSPSSDLLLASASQDKYIRLWRVHQGKELPAAATTGSDPALRAFLPGKSLSNKAHRFVAGGVDYSATFEALLLGHEDWIYSATWRSRENTLRLLSASADNSLSVWEQDPISSVWVSVARLGEISGQKGSTTATGSTGGFWTGLWSPSGQKVACLGRTGSWRLWDYDGRQERWIQDIGVSGHTQAVTGIAWSRQGDYILSTSSDQTTRLHARWKRNGQTTWHEMARPQIHGYDLNCIDSLGESQFVSGADEKLLRVFQEPKAVAELLTKLCNITSSQIQSLPDAANMPVLGLSNKAISALSSADLLEDPTNPDIESIDPTSIADKTTLDLAHPPLEDHLSKHTLWPETEKLYGHGYEISALAASHDGSVVATACKASSLDHAVIRLFETASWTELKPSLAAHSLTVTRLRFSADDRHLLSVGRDRQWAVFERQDRSYGGNGNVTNEGHGPGKGGVDYKLLEVNPKAHSRMILDAAWAPLSPSLLLSAGEEGNAHHQEAFATAGRDKSVKVWKRRQGKENVNENGDKNSQTSYVHAMTIQEESPVTAVDFLDSLLSMTTEEQNQDGDANRQRSTTSFACLAVGTEAGRLLLYRIDLLGWCVCKKFEVGASSCPSQAITQLSWRPSSLTTRKGDRGRGRKRNEEATAPATAPAIADGVLSEEEKSMWNDDEDEEQEGDDETVLAVASEDCSLRIYALKSLLLLLPSRIG